MPGGFPVTLTRLETKLCMVVGGGQVAERKVYALLAADARVRIVAPVITVRLQELAEERIVEWAQRRWEADDLQGCFLVIAATDDPKINHEVATEALERGCLVNVVDDPDYCNFLTPAVIQRGDLTIAISTGGQVPALSGYLRSRLENEFGPEWESYLTLLSQMRDEIRERFPDLNARCRAWRRILEAGLEKQVAGGSNDSIRERIREIIDSLRDES